MSVSRIKFLLNAYLQGTGTRQENEELFSMILTHKEQESLELGLLEYIHNAEARDNLSGDLQVRMLKEILDTTAAAKTTGSAMGKGEANRAGKNTGGYRPGWISYAAVLVVLITAGMYLWLTDEEKGGTHLITAEKADIAPGSDKAVLTLADGTTIVLDSAGSGMLAQQGELKVIKLNAGALAYSSGKQAQVSVGGKPLYNTLSTPRGGQYQVVLADGTKVWLNAASSLRFPVDFTDSERRVEVTGEAYFEVAGNRSQPFTVAADSVEIEVLGTCFNVNAYPDEASINTTLVEGAVRLKSGDERKVLKPGQQVRVAQKDQAMMVLNSVEVEEVVAWRNGKFVFNETPIELAMRKISRWYDVEVAYKGKVPDQRFNGVLSRNRSLSQILKVLEISEVHFKMEGKRVIVMP